MSSTDDDLQKVSAIVNTYCEKKKVKSLPKFLGKVVDVYAEIISDGDSDNPEPIPLSQGLDDSEPCKDDDDDDNEEEIIISSNDFLPSPIFETPATVKSKREQRMEKLRVHQQKQFEKIKSQCERQESIEKMVQMGNKNWRQRPTQVHIYLAHYRDGFSIDEGRLYDYVNDKKILESFERGRVPDRFNPYHCRDIDVHVLWEDCKFEDRKKDKRSSSSNLAPQIKKFIEHEYAKRAENLKDNDEDPDEESTTVLGKRKRENEEDNPSWKKQKKK